MPRLKPVRRGASHYTDLGSPTYLRSRSCPICGGKIQLEEIIDATDPTQARFWGFCKVCDTIKVYVANLNAMMGHDDEFVILLLIALDGLHVPSASSASISRRWSPRPILGPARPRRFFPPAKKSAGGSFFSCGFFPKGVEGRRGCRSTKKFLSRRTTL